MTLRCVIVALTVHFEAVCEGYTFKGWRGFKYDVGGKASEEIYAAGDTVPLYRNTTLSAVWEPVTPNVKLNPNYDYLYFTRGNAYYLLKQYERAIQNYDKATALNPNYVEVYINRGVLYMDALKDYQRAVQNFDKVIQINPNFDKAYYNRGNAHYLLKQYERAIQDNSKAIQLNPNYIKAYNSRGACYRELGDEAKAQADFAKAKELR